MRLLARENRGFDCEVSRPTFVVCIYCGIIEV